jgi:hypothetical protein
VRIAPVQPIAFPRFEFIEGLADGADTQAHRPRELPLGDPVIQGAGRETVPGGDGRTAKKAGHERAFVRVRRLSSCCHDVGRAHPPQADLSTFFLRVQRGGCRRWTFGALPPRPIDRPRATYRAWLIGTTELEPVNVRPSDDACRPHQEWCSDKRDRGEQKPSEPTRACRLLDAPVAPNSLMSVRC